MLAKSLFDLKERPERRAPMFGRENLEYTEKVLERLREEAGEETAQFYNRGGRLKWKQVLADIVEYDVALAKLHVETGRAEQQNKRMRVFVPDEDN